MMKALRPVPSCILADGRIETIRLLLPYRWLQRNVDSPLLKSRLPHPCLHAEPPHMILRAGLIKGLRYSTMAADMGTFLAKTLFFSSALHLTGAQMKAEIGRWSSNWPMCEVTEQVSWLISGSFRMGGGCDEFFSVVIVLPVLFQRLEGS